VTQSHGRDSAASSFSPRRGRGGSCCFGGRSGYGLSVTVENAHELAQVVFERRDEGDWSGARDAAQAYLHRVPERDDPELVDLTADVTALLLETTAEIDAGQGLQLANDVFERYRSRREPNLPSVAAFALRIKVALLINAGQRDQASAAGEQLLQLFGERADAGRQLDTASQLIEVAYMLLSRGETDVADQLLRAVTRRLGNDTDSAVYELLAHAQVLLVATIIYAGTPERLPEEIRVLQAMGQPALAASQRLIRRWGDNPYWQKAVLSALANEVAILHQLGRDADASAALADLHDRADAINAPELRTMLDTIAGELAPE
jgi:hypothetical protein